MKKQSLICSLRILQDDVNHQAEQWSINKNSRSGKKKDGARSTKTSAHDEHESNNPFRVNKFNSLVIEDPLINDDPVNKLNKKETSQNANGKSNQKKLKKSKELKNQNQNAPDRSTTDNGGSISQNNNTIIVGDSMLKMLNAGRMRRFIGQNVVIKTFPGAKTSYMKHYVQPALLMKPKRMIIHVGTNDISKGAEPKAVVNGIEDLCKGIVNSNKSIQITISEIIIRDNLELATKIKTANELLINICLNHGWKIVQHINIHVNNLNASGLHLNRVGTSLLAKNFIELLNTDSN